MKFPSLKLNAIRKLTTALGALSLCLGVSSSAWANIPQVSRLYDSYYWKTGNNLGQKFYENGRWHYGVDFAGYNGTSKYFSGPSGTFPSDYQQNGWWGNQPLGTLIVETRFLFYTGCLGIWGNYGMCWDRWTASNHNGLVMSANSGPNKANYSISKLDDETKVSEVTPKNEASHPLKGLAT